MAKTLARKAAARIARDRLGVALDARGSVDLRVIALRAALAEAYAEGWRQAHAAQRMNWEPGDLVFHEPGDK